MHITEKESTNDGARYIYRTYITVKGVKRYAKDYGKKAFKIPIE